MGNRHAAIPFPMHGIASRNAIPIFKENRHSAIPFPMHGIAPRNAIPTFQENQHAAIPIPYASKSYPLQSSQGSHVSRARLLLQSARRGLS